ncbi:hypothetical protein LRP88_07384 [Fusarium phalaenopsidis]
MGLDASLRFMTFPNANEGDLTPDQEEKAKFVEQVFKSPNWPQALDVVDNAEGPIKEEFDQGVEQSKKLDGSNSARHQKIVLTAQKWLQEYLADRDVKDLDPERLSASYQRAIEFTQSQKSHMNGLGITIDGLVDRQQKSRLDKAVTVFVISGSMLPTHQKDAIMAKLSDAQPGAQEIKALILAITKDDSTASMKLVQPLRAVDNANKGAKDFIALVHLSAEKLLDLSISSILLQEAMNDHGGKFKETNSSRLYGPTSLCGQGQLCDMIPDVAAIENGMRTL